MRDDGRDPDLEEALAALGMRPGALRAWLEDRRRLCIEHGGARRYPEVLALVETCLGRTSVKEEEPRC